MEKQFKVKLVIRRAPALAALGWLKHSWQIFVQAPLVWVLMFVTLAAMALLGQLHPLLAIGAIMLNPFLTAGVYKAIVAVQQKQAIDFSMLFTALQESACRPVFVRLAALNLLASVPVSMLASTLIQQHEQQLVDGITVLAFVSAAVLVWMIFAYAVAIAYFLQEHRLFTVVQSSFMACWRNIVPLVLFALLSMGLIMLTMPTMFIGLLVVVPVLNIAFFLSFNEFFALQVKADEGVLEV